MLLPTIACQQPTSNTVRASTLYCNMPMPTPTMRLAAYFVICLQLLSATQHVASFAPPTSTTGNHNNNWARTFAGGKRRYSTAEITTKTSTGGVGGGVSSSLSMVFDPISSTQLLLSETEPWVQPVASVLDPFLNVMSLAMLVRVVLSWYPTTKITDVPWIFAVIPTEPLLKSVRGVIPPAFGVDITPIFWVAVFTFVHEILLGQQGLLTMKIKYGI